MGLLDCSGRNRWQPPSGPCRSAASPTSDDHRWRACYFVSFLRRPNTRKPPAPTKATASTIKPRLAEPPPASGRLFCGADDAVGEGEELPGTDSVDGLVEAAGVMLAAAEAAVVEAAVAETVPLLDVAVTCAALVAVGVAGTGLSCGCCGIDHGCRLCGGCGSGGCRWRCHRHCLARRCGRSRCGLGRRCVR